MPLPKSHSRKAGPQKSTALDPEDFNSTDDEFEGFLSSESERTDNESDSSDSSAEADDYNKKQIAKLAKEALKDRNLSNDKSRAENSGIVYVGRLPHGFYEKQMREYFGQFGAISKLRMSRNKRTGASKHYAFMEFEHPEIANIVCETMDNYLLFGHLLKVKRVAPENVHKSLFTGANKNFQIIPWGKVGKRRYERKQPREMWEDRQADFDSRRKAKNKRLKSLGINYTL
ncbi:hypothetical protein B9G98_01059 [Wickerhamiella sorbophila]|uniref:RRM domain-containing protein n=1 Tax=Wickerhamiella sorbophila TaxID=45607 RepID=A0A2T0FEQ2_9ASCO|nr:hypothetical protein B9G98_01059 [Wickerhamiella sorbophila]PRT53439.1 hypothetical protein B9G98_01059 [Wickerhamiella sorbophila]